MPIWSKSLIRLSLIFKMVNDSIVSKSSDQPKETGTLTESELLKRNPAWNLHSAFKVSILLKLRSKYSIVHFLSSEQKSGIDSSLLKLMFNFFSFAKLYEIRTLEGVEQAIDVGGLEMHKPVGSWRNL